jgi:ribosome maturation protein SDO1
MKAQTFDQEKISINVARLKTHGENFEIVIDPEKAIKFRHGEGDIREALKAEKIFHEAIRGDFASEEKLKEVFKTDDALKIAEQILKEGSIQINDEYRDKLRNEAKKHFIEILLRNGVDAETGTALTATRISNAMNEAKVHLDVFNKVEPQVDEVVVKLKPVLKISFEKKILNIRIPALNAGKLYGVVAHRGKIIDEAWLSDGSWSAKVECVPGAVAVLMDELKSKTHGDVEITIEQTKRR